MMMTSTIWESDAESFSVIKDPRGNTLGRGTTISLQLKEEAHDYLEETTLKNLVKKYSQFINFNIHLWSSQEVEEPLGDEESKSEPKKKLMMMMKFSHKVLLNLGLIEACSIYEHRRETEGKQQRKYYKTYPETVGLKTIYFISVYGFNYNKDHKKSIDGKEYKILTDCMM
ncbi:hypothetical protein Btru_052529 [Bulinus truncatus]|nr:hypothetical protein Btru_052529 [Bulinus truncatus]